MPRASVIGLGYVGLTMAACLADNGVPTLGVEIDRDKLTLLKRGVTPIYEPDLQETLARCLEADRLRITDVDLEAMETSDLTFVTVGTPSNPDGSINLNQIRDACKSVGSSLKRCSGYRLVVIRSTVTPGTTEHVAKPTIESASGKSCGIDFGLCTNPEFLREGHAVHDMTNPDRIVIGECDKQAGDTLENFYKTFYGERMPSLVRTSPPNAELIKYASNAFLATKVSFINSIANLCQKIPRADVETVAHGMSLDPRIGPHFLRAGLGWGGSCFPKDVSALLSYATKLRAHLPIVEAAVRVNELQPHTAVQQAKAILKDLAEKNVAVLGLAFKPDTDDIREAVSIRIIEALLKDRAHVVAYDPKATENVRRIFGNRISYARSAIECIRGTDCCIIATEWDEFGKLTAEDFLKMMRTPIVIDGRRIFDPRQFMPKLKFSAVGLGIEQHLT